MSKTITLISTVRIGDAEVTGEIAVTAGGRQIVNESVSASQTATLVVPIDASALKLIYLICDRRMSFEFAGPDNAFTLEANEPFTWSAESNVPNPFGSTDVESILCENEEALTATVRMWVLTDSTP